MDLFTENDLRDLVTMRSKYCISLFMPTYKVGADIQQNAPRFKILFLKHRNCLFLQVCDRPKL